MGSSPRDRRLASDRRGLVKLREMSAIFDFTSEGNPPDKYELIFNGKGLARNEDGEVEIAHRHVCKVRLSAAYPRLKPDLTWDSKIYHPNISEGGMVCIGGFGTNWVPSLQLDELCEMLWDMIRFANYDTRSAYNYAAAKWLLAQKVFTLPVDPRPLRDRVASGEVKPEEGDAVRVKRAAAAPTKPQRPVARVTTARQEQPADDVIQFSGGDEDLLVLKDE